MTVFATIPHTYCSVEIQQLQGIIENRQFLRVDMEVIISQVVLSYRLILEFLEITGNHYELSQQPLVTLEID